MSSPKKIFLKNKIKRAVRRAGSNSSDEKKQDTDKLQRGARDVEQVPDGVKPAQFFAEREKHDAHRVGNTARQ